MTNSAPLRALLTNLIDYAGLYPPASLPMAQVIANYERYLAGPENWMLNRLVLPASRMSEIDPKGHWRVTLIADEEPFDLPPCVESIETRDLRSFTQPVYRELPIDDVQDGFAEIRTATISSEELAEFLMAAAARRLAFKATAGLHHAVPGFINVFSAAAFAWHGADQESTVDLLNEPDATAFTFSQDAIKWRDRTLTTSQIMEARRDFAHSFGSCSFDEPIEDLKQLSWL